MKLTGTPSPNFTPMRQADGITTFRPMPSMPSSPIQKQPPQIPSLPATQPASPTPTTPQSHSHAPVNEKVSFPDMAPKPLNTQSLTTEQRIELGQTSKDGNVLKKLAQDANPEVRKAAFGNPALSESVYRPALETMSDQEKLALATGIDGKGKGETILGLLKYDENPQVSRAARANLNNLKLVPGTEMPSADEGRKIDNALKQAGPKSEQILFARMVKDAEARNWLMGDADPEIRAAAASNDGFRGLHLNLD